MHTNRQKISFFLIDEKKANRYKISTDSNMHDPRWIFANKNETLGI